MCEKQALNEDLHIYNWTRPPRQDAPDAYGSHTVIGSGWRRIIYKDEVLNLESACKSSLEGRQVVKTLNWPPTHMSEKNKPETEIFTSTGHLDPRQDTADAAAAAR